MNAYCYDDSDGVFSGWCRFFFTLLFAFPMLS